MNEQKIAEALGIPWYKIIPLGKDPETLKELISLAFAKGFQSGQADICENYNKAFRGYDPVIITN